MMNNPDGEQHRHRVGILGYYWFLTFEHATDLHALTEECQQVISVEHFNLVPAGGLHLTLDRIARDGECTPQQLGSIASAARRACRNRSPFIIRLERASNLHGAIGFDVEPVASFRSLRNTLRTATLSVYPEAPIKDSMPRSLAFYAA
jgi:hypothetical protein